MAAARLFDFDKQLTLEQKWRTEKGVKGSEFLENGGEMQTRPSAGVKRGQGNSPESVGRCCGCYRTPAAAAADSGPFAALTLCLSRRAG